jgi:hypothetical protein
MSQFDKVIFGKKKFSDILEEIYNNQQKKDKQVVGLINELKPLINEVGDATLVVPLIKEYLDIGIKNDDLLIKMATLTQRVLSTDNENSESFGLSEEEIQSLMNSVKDNHKNKK